MFYTPAALALLLASATAKENPMTRDVVNAQLQALNTEARSHMIKMAEKQRKAMEKAGKKMVKAESSLRKRELSEGLYLNIDYYTNADCSDTPYASVGWKSGECITRSIPEDSDVYGLKFVCFVGTDSEDAIVGTGELGVEWYESGDCSDQFLVDASTFDNDGTCAASIIDDDFRPAETMFDDDKQGKAGPYFQYDMMQMICGPARDTSFDRIEYYSDAACTNTVAYSGMNKGSCIPFKDFEGMISSNCDANIYTANTTCTGDYQSFDTSSDGADDDFRTWGECTKRNYDDGSEFLLPSKYLMTTECSSDDVSDDGDDDVCFAGSETVLLQSGDVKAMSDVSVGDMVQVVTSDGSLTFSEVVFLPHSANTDKATFTELQLASGKSLRATPSHLVMAGACGGDVYDLMAMKYVSTGDCVQTTAGQDEVTGSELVVDHGVYTLVTKETSGLIVVNGVHASSFAHNHWLVNQYYNIHRAVYEFAPSLLKNRDVVAANLIVGDIAMMSV